MAAAKENIPKAEADANQRLGFLQLCADKRFHRAICLAFETVGRVDPQRYWLEATAGGSPALDPTTPTSAHAVLNGATVFGWAAHGDDCGGFAGHATVVMRALLHAAIARRALAYPRSAEHWGFLAVDPPGATKAGANEAALPWVEIYRWDADAGAVVRHGEDAVCDPNLGCTLRPVPTP